jgi:hypothetical protein
VTSETVCVIHALEEEAVLLHPLDSEGIIDAAHGCAYHPPGVIQDIIRLQKIDKGTNHAPLPVIRPSQDTSLCSSARLLVPDKRFGE